ncbi:hypothetical protein KKE19_02490 [Patescibacteria group bacterium]|nr:hypothetical protein [Patescibacteria group bacterium]MBU4367704.1 hypothetical protein [Patescibacteria group bacterium]
MKEKIKIIINLIFVILIGSFMGYILRFFGITNEQIGDLILISVGIFVGYQLKTNKIIYERKN